MKPSDQPQSRPTHAAVDCLDARDEKTGDSRSEADDEGIAMMWGAGRTGGLRRGATDFTLALVLFWAIALLFDAGQSRAYAVSLPALAKEAIQPSPSLSRPQPCVPSSRCKPPKSSIGHKPAPSCHASC